MIGRISRCLIWGLFGCIGVAMTWYFVGRGGPSLEPWHTEALSAEFTAKEVDAVRTFDDYRQLEGKLFAQLEEQVYLRVGTGPAYALVRYSSGSAADPQLYAPNWNRSFELATDSPVGGALLLHGMSDSPYTFRALGVALNQRKYWVVGLRLPGHGTAPSGLLNITWEDMAAAVQLGMEHLASKVGHQPIHVLGYSTGAPLALNFTLDALEGKASPLPAGLVLISPAVGLHPAAKLAGVLNRLSAVPGLARLAWLSIEPEFDPFKYNSFATNAGMQVSRLTRDVARRIAVRGRSGPIRGFPPTLVFKSAVDATVSADAVVDNLLKHLGADGHELVLFDINRFAAKSTLLIDDPSPLSDRLMTDATLPFTVTLVTNESPQSRSVIARRKAPFARAAAEITHLDLSWPTEVISLSHVALPFPPDDPLYGQHFPKDDKVLFLGQMAIRGERGLLRISSEWLLRLRFNPFYDFLESRTLEWVDNAGGRQAVSNVGRGSQCGDYP
ncbi:alpha/beta hydrolase [Desulfoferrobacter suflitae]|uniref:alpha/beta hydrolase n=1 Tax=Desulfoferrobacter suflitae TaxID=2865782 RepID=UPI0021645FEE|nr:alpha/beta fold hydrolase [Desulfoferrobacter suflitae]MCK8603424.1 alpha/beta hydrolase [Desulfoferrobacter suflitae]